MRIKRENYAILVILRSIRTTDPRKFVMGSIAVRGHFVPRDTLEFDRNSGFMVIRMEI